MFRRSADKVGRQCTNLKGGDYKQMRAWFKISYWNECEKMMTEDFTCVEY